MYFLQNYYDAYTQNICLATTIYLISFPNLQLIIDVALPLYRL
jgi:hypothetical protein